MAVRATQGGYTLRIDANASGYAFSGMQMLPSFPIPEKYFVWVSGTTYRAMNTRNGFVEQSGTDFSTIIQTILDSHAGNGVNIRLGTGVYTVESPISFPVTNGLGFAIHGADNRVRNQLPNTSLSIGSGFPISGRYIFEHIGPVDNQTTTRSRIKLTDMHWHNVDTFATTRAGGLRYESDYGVVDDQVVIERISTNLLAYPIHIIGYTYGGVMRDINIHDTSNSFSGEFCIMFERDYFGWDRASGLAASGTIIHYDVPKLWAMENINLQQAESGVHKYGLCIEGAYNYITNLKMDTGAYNYPIVFRGCSFSNKIFGLRTQDLNSVPPGGEAQATLILDGSGTFSGGYGPRHSGTAAQYAPSSAGQNYTNYDNKIYGAMASAGRVASGRNIAFAGSGFRNYVECSVFGGTTLTVDDAAAGRGNLLVVQEGQVLATSGSVKVRFSGNINVRDERQGAEGRGLFQDSGGKAIYTIPHGLFAAPEHISITPASPQASEVSGISPSVSGGTTNINVRYGDNTQSGNVWMYWTAGVYDTV